MKFKKFLATLLSVAMVLSMLSVGALANENEENGVMPIAETEDTAPVTTSFGDAADSWATTSIERWSATGIVKGDNNGNFNPEAQLSRAELAQIFVNMLGLTEKAENTFADLTGSEWYADAILKCAAAGIMKGDGVNAKAETNISRGETIVMFGRAVGVTPDAEPDLSDFTDADTVADWAAGYLAPLTKMGILSGSGDGTINAIGDIDRASTMSLLDKAIGEYVNAPGEYEVKDANKFVVINVAAKEGEVVISGTAAGVTVSAGTAEGKIVAKDLKADSIKVDGTAALSVEGKSAVGAVVANATGEVAIAKGVTVNTVTANAAGTINNSGTVKELVANAPAKVDNQGTITKAEVKADGVVLDGKKPTDVKVEEGTKNPTNSSGTEIKPTPDRPTGGGGGGSSVTYADVIKATLHDTRADAGEAGTYVADEDIAKNYSVSGTVSGDEVNVTVTANHLMQHKAGDGAGLGYWVGVGIPQSTTDTENQYAVGFGDYDKTNETFDATRDNTMEQNSKTYDTFYFGVRENTTKGYIAVKNGEKTTVYNITFNVTLAAPIENLDVFVVHDEASYAKLPADYIKDNAWNEAYEEGFPWLVAVYDRNVAETVNFAVTRDGTTVTPTTTAATAGTIREDAYMMWEFADRDGANEDNLGLNKGDFGNFVVTVTAATSNGAVSDSFLHRDPEANYFTVTFDAQGGSTVAPVENVVDGGTLGANMPANPTKTGYTFGGWYTEVEGAGTSFVNSTAVTASITVYAKWTVNTYTIAFGANGGNGTTADVSATYDADATLTTNAFTKVGYTFNGWNTLADGTGTAYADEATVKNLATTGTVTLYAQWTAIPVTSEETLKNALLSDLEVIEITGTIGSSSAYTQYEVARAVTIKGGTVFGNFLVKVDGTVFDGVTVDNKGDVSGETTLARSAIYANCQEITIKDCTFKMTASAGGLSNGVTIYPTDTNVTYEITGNTFTGYQQSENGWSSSALLLVANSTKMSETPSKLADLTDEQDLAIIKGNTFNECKIDYSRYTAGSPNQISCTSISNGGNTRFATAASTAKYYITGDVTRETSSKEAELVIKAGTEVIITKGSSLTIDTGVALTIGGTISGEGAIVGKDATSVLRIAVGGNWNDTVEPGDRSWNGEGWDPAVVATMKVMTQEELAAVTGDGAFAGLSDHASYLGTTVEGNVYTLTGEVHALTSGTEITGFGTVGTTTNLTTDCVIIPFQFTPYADATALSYEVWAGESKAYGKDNVELDDDGTWMHFMQKNIAVGATEEITVKMTWTIGGEALKQEIVINFADILKTAVQE